MFIGTVVICIGKAKFEENMIIEFHNVSTLLIKLIEFLQTNLNAGFKSYIVIVKHVVNNFLAQKWKIHIQIGTESLVK